MKIFMALVFSAAVCVPSAFARNQIDTLSPVKTISSEELAANPNRSLDDILKAAPGSTDEVIAQHDLRAANLRSGNTLFLVDGRRTDQDISSIPREQIEQVEVLKDGASSIYGSDAISGVVNVILKKPVYPDEMPQPSAFSAVENQWLSSNIPIGRIGIGKQDGQYNFGLSTYTNNQWSWQPSWGLGQSYGYSGPIVALGKTPQGPALSVFSPNGVFVGGVYRKPRQTGMVGQYLIGAQYPRLQTFSIDNAILRNNFDPYGTLILPYEWSMGDIYRFADMLDLDLDDFDSYEDFMEEVEDQTGGCIPMYPWEPIFPRTVLDAPNDPLYQKSKQKKKKGLVSGVLGGLVNVGGGVIGMGERSTDDKKGPAVYDQYSLPQIGFTPISDPQSAWNLVDANSKNVIVAVVDSGLDLSHPDGPQYVLPGWNFLDENDDVKDLRGHGTVVAGIIAAKSNNGIGIAGINPGAVILPLKVADKHGNTNSLNIFRAIHYAVAHGARVINVSLGARNVSQLERLAINFARTHGVLVVVASGNEGEDITGHGPAAVGSAVAVGAVNFDGTRSTVSNWGANNALMAPGEEIYSLQSKDAPWEGPSGARERLYTKMSGTSFAAPMAAATASLLLVKDPKLTPYDLEDILLSSARRMGKEYWEGRTGAGFLDAAQALRSVGAAHFNVRVTGLQAAYKPKTKKVESVDVYATVRGDVDYFLVELGKGKNARSFKPVIGIAGQQASDDLVAHLDEKQLRGSNEWLVQVRAKDKAGKEYIAQLPLILK